MVINVRFEVSSIASHSPFLIGPAITRSRELRAKKKTVGVLKGSHQCLLGAPQYSALPAEGA